MNKLESLEQEAYDDNVKVHNYYLGEDNLKGFYIDGNIAINTSVNTTTEKACVLAEELGHHYTSVGNIIDMDSSSNRKQERQDYGHIINKSDSKVWSEHTNMVVLPAMRLQNIWMSQKKLCKNALNFIGINTGNIKL